MRQFPIRIIFVCAAVANILVSILSIFIAVQLKSDSSGAEIATHVLKLVILQFFLSWGLFVLTNWVTMREEIRLRQQLLKNGEVKRSTANVEVLIGINALRWFIYTPGLALSSLIYLFFTYTLSPALFALFVVSSLTLALPLIRYFTWRGAQIGKIRQLRGQLVDKDHSQVDRYGKYLNTYSLRLENYWRRDVILGAGFRVCILAFILLGYALNRDHPNLLGIVVIQVVLLAQLRTLFLDFSIFQEDFRSLKAVWKKLA